MTRKLLLILTFIFSGTVLFAQLPKIIFTPHWLPQAQFSGYYIAQEKGFYKELGIDVEIAHPSASVMATERLRNGESDIISLFLITALALKSNDLDLVNIAQWSQNSALLFVTKKESGLSKLSDLNGKKIGIWESGFDEVPKALVNSNNYNVTWVPILSTINLFMLGGIDAMTVMSYNEYDQIINSGINPDELNTFFFSDYGYNIPEDGLYCLNKTFETRKEDLQKFLKATMKGWEYAKANKQETLDIVLALMKKEFIPTNIAHQRWMLDKVLEQMEPGTKNVMKGELAEPDFHKTQNLLIEGGYLKEKIGFGEFYKPAGE
jgi:NitT/TauT family transport system substrate-binding protein